MVDKKFIRSFEFATNFLRKLAGNLNPIPINWFSIISGRFTFTRRRTFIDLCLYNTIHCFFGNFSLVHKPRDSWDFAFSKTRRSLVRIYPVYNCRQVTLSRKLKRHLRCNSQIGNWRGEYCKKILAIRIFYDIKGEGPRWP